MSPQNKRKTGKEQYYTPPCDAERLTSLALQKIGGLGDSVFIEPAAGMGAFVDSARKLGANANQIRAWDIEPLHPMVLQTSDFLLEDLSSLKNCVCVTNPPYGRANSLNVRFFNKLAPHCRSIAFLVPLSWRKWSVINRLDRRFNLVHDQEEAIDFNYASSAGKSSGKLKTCFQVWVNSGVKRKLIDVEDRGYIKKCFPFNADAAITVFGRSCGKVEFDFQRVPNTTKMYVKINEPWVYEELPNLDYERFYKNTAFVEALSIKEIQHLLNERADAKFLRNP